jgi:hypothetical protein
MVPRARCDEAGAGLHRAHGYSIHAVAAPEGGASSFNVVFSNCDLMAVGFNRRFTSQAALPVEKVQANKMAFVDELKSMPIAIETATANEQHYEVRVIMLHCLAMNPLHAVSHGQPADVSRRAF